MHTKSRKPVSLLLGAIALGVLVGTQALAGTEAPAELRTARPDDGVSLAARKVPNADKVDGRHAVGAKATRKQRANKLVATDKLGRLPPDIVKPRWKLITGMPAGFRDGRDDQGVTHFYVREKSVTANAAIGGGDTNVRCDGGDYATGGSVVSMPPGAFIAQGLPDAPASAGGAPIGWGAVYERIQSGVTGTITVYVICADAK